jgi:integrase
MSGAEMTVTEAIDRYMAGYSGRDRSLGSRLAFFEAALGPRPLASITDDDVHQLMQALEAGPARRFVGRGADGQALHKARPTPRSPATLNRYRSSFAGLCTWARRQRLVPKDWAHPCRGLPSYSESEGVVRFLDADERTRLLQAAAASSWARLYVLVLMALSTGARRGELMGLRWSEVDLQRRTALIRRTKNGKAKVLPLIPAVVEALEPLRRQDARRFADPGARLVFHSPRRPDRPFEFQKAWRAALASARVRSFRFHDLRHSCASWLAQEGASLLEIADVLGHRQLRMTQRYAHLTVASKASLIGRVMGDLR